MKKLKPIDYGIISELIKDSRLSDRQVAKKIGTSQPTVTRRRIELDKERLIDYTAVPDLKKLGFEILAFTFGNWNFKEYPDTRVEEMKKIIEAHPNVLFISTGSGMGWDRMGISVHKDYTDYLKVIQDYKTGWGKCFKSFSSFIVSLQSDNVLRNITFRYLAELMKKEHSKEEQNREE
jgi:DNA-binding Lrp family transcriptional regulator